jgi:large subunit ribosomal protein L25
MAKTKHQIKAEIRTVFGKKVKSLRKLGQVPSTVYGHGFDPISIQINSLEIEKLFSEVGESGLVEMTLDSKKIPILFKNPQYHPVSDMLLHLDCHHVNLNEVITAMVPIELIGESPTVKLGNVLVSVMDEVEVECLPGDLPESIEIDISKLDSLESQITVADLDIDRKKVNVLSHADLVIVMIEAPRAEEEVIETEATTPTVAPASNQKTPEEMAAKAAEKKAEKEKKED